MKEVKNDKRTILNALKKEKSELEAEAKLKELYFSDLDRELDALRESVMKSTETLKKDCIEVINFYKTAPYAVGVGYSTKEVLDNIKGELRKESEKI